MPGAADELPPAAPPLVDAAELRTWVIRDDEQLLVLDKPGWLVCHPSKNGPWSSLAGAVREVFKPDVIRFVFRLDRETSGVIVLAKTEAMGGRLGKAILHGKIGKLYVALLEGEFTEPVTVNQPLGPDPTANVTVKSRVVAGARSHEAVTIFHPLLVRGGFTLAGVEALTGRNHHISAHAQRLPHPVVGANLYAPD